MKNSSSEVKPHFTSSLDHHFVLYTVVNLHTFGKVEECTQLFAHGGHEMLAFSLIMCNNESQFNFLLLFKLLTKLNQCECEICNNM